MTTNAYFTQHYKYMLIGETYENAFARFLVAERGWKVLSTCQMHNDYDHAPCFAGLDENVIVPDLLATKDGGMRWFESKQKTRADLHHNSGRLVTGIDLFAWQAYRRIEQITGVEVAIIFIHCAENVVVGGTLTELAKHISHKHLPREQKAMIYFKFDELPCWLHTSQLQQYVEAQP